MRDVCTYTCKRFSKPWLINLLRQAQLNSLQYCTTVLINSTSWIIHLFSQNLFFPFLSCLPPRGTTDNETALDHINHWGITPWSTLVCVYTCVCLSPLPQTQQHSSASEQLDASEGWRAHLDRRRNDYNATFPVHLWMLVHAVLDARGFEGDDDNRLKKSWWMMHLGHNAYTLYLYMTLIYPVCLWRENSIVQCTWQRVAQAEHE